jgi:hypothetical protein
MNRQQEVEATLNNLDYEVLDIEEFLKEHYENLETAEYNIDKFKTIYGVE